MSTDQRIKDYLGNGGLFNPEHMEHGKVRDLILDCQADLATCREIIKDLGQTIRDSSVVLNEIKYDLYADKVTLDYEDNFDGVFHARDAMFFTLEKHQESINRILGKDNG